MTDSTSRSCHRVIRLAWSILLLIVCTNTFAQEGSPLATAQTSDDYKKAFATFARLDQSDNFSESLAYADMNVLPMGIKQTLNNIEVTIAVSDIRWETQYSELTVFARVKLPQDNGKLLFFGA